MLRFVSQRSPMPTKLQDSSEPVVRFTPMPSRMVLTPGFTVTVFAACVAGLILTAVVIQNAEVLLAFPTPVGEFPLALAGVWAFWGLCGVALLLGLPGRRRIFSGPQRLLILYVMLLAAPLITQGFWHRVVAVTATIPRGGDWEKLDALNDHLWPHGPNRLASALTPKNSDLLLLGGASWIDDSFEPNRVLALPLMKNTRPEQVSSVRIRLACREGASLKTPGGAIEPFNPHLLSILVKARDLGPQSHYFCRFIAHPDAPPVELFSGSAVEKRTAIQPLGFVRIGTYGVKFDAATGSDLWLEFGLSGEGRVEFAEPKLLDVSTLEGVYKGRRIVRERDLSQLPAAQRAMVIVRPERMFSWAGLKFILAGYIPVKDWLIPLGAWGLFLAIVLSGTFAITALLRRQWMDAERYPLPMGRVTLSLCGLSESPLLRNKWTWGGVALGLSWTALNAMHVYNTNVPDVTLHTDLQSWLSGAWAPLVGGAIFEINVLFLSICLLMELNILASLVLGFWIFQCQNLIGHWQGWDNISGFPFHPEQQLGAFVMYAVAIMLLAWKYWGSVFRRAIVGGQTSEPLSPRSMLLLLAVTILAGILWARWMGVSLPGMMLFLAVLLAIGMVSAKLRTECGTPWGYFVPAYPVLSLVLLGGIVRFGPAMILFGFLASYFMGPSSFFTIPGGQLELLELAHRQGLRGRHVLGAIALALVGGLLIGGWVFLSNAYSIGGESFQQSWVVDGKPWYFTPFNTQLIDATQSMAGKTSEDQQSGIPPVWIAVGFAGLSTVAVTLLRQVFSGFWFHPLGLLLGSTYCAAWLWGSALLAWIIRRLTVSLGGATTIRDRLVPTAIGLFCGGVIGELGWWMLATGAHATGADILRRSL